MSTGLRIAIIVLLAGLEGFLLLGLPRESAPRLHPPARVATPVLTPLPEASRPPIPTPSRGPRLSRKEYERRQVARLSRETEQIRHLGFRKPVATAPRTRRQARAYIERELDRETDWKAEEAGLKQFGFIPGSFELRPYFIDFYTSQVAGWYDPGDGAYHMIEDPPTLASRAWGVASDMLQPGSRTDLEEIAMVHELDHALTDQHYRLKPMQDRVLKLKNGDVSLALQSLIEGDATLVMYKSQYLRMGVDPDEVVFEPGAFASVEWIAGLFSNAEFRSAPPYFQKVLLFPYLTGCTFVDYQRARFGWKGVNEMYARPPRSSEQILHPEKYRVAPDWPVPIRWGGPATMPGWTQVAENTLGELGIRTFFEVHGVAPGNAAVAASRWGGDSFRVFEKAGATAQRCMVWSTAWDEEASAGMFSHALLEAMARKHGLTTPSGGSPAPEPWRLEGPRHVLVLTDGRVVSVERRGARVVVLEGVPEELVGLLERMGWAAVPSRR